MLPQKSDVSGLLVVVRLFRPLVTILVIMSVALFLRFICFFIFVSVCLLGFCGFYCELYF